MDSPSTSHSLNQPQASKGLGDFFRRKSKKLDPEKMLAAASAVVAVLSPVMDLVSEISSNAGIPGVKFGIDCLSHVLNKFQEISATKEGVKALQDRISPLIQLLQSFAALARERRIPQPMRQRFARFVRAWEDVLGDAAVLILHGNLRAFYESKTDAAELSRLVEKTNGLIQQFIIESNVAIELAIHDLASQTDESLMPQHAQGARYDQDDARKESLLGTRTNIIEDICNRILTEDGERVILLSGAAGTGKTSIAYSIARWCDDPRRRLLGASFFCSRSDAECSNVGLVFSTVVYQLCCFSAEFKEHVFNVVRKDRSVLHAGVTRQVKELLARPLQQMGRALRHCIMIFDALDECNDDAPVSTVLTAIQSYATSDWPKVIVTSRPERRVVAAFSRYQPQTLPASHLVLHEVQLPTVLSDITLFLRHSFSDTRSMYGLPPEWPKTEDIDALARLSGGVFLVASTAMKIIQDPKSSRPMKQLERILSMKLSLTGVDALYEEITINSFPEMDEDIRAILSKTLGALVVLQRPLPPASLAVLIGSTEADVRGALSGLHSVLLVPEDNSHPIRFFHPTFCEFLLRYRDHKPSSFHIDPAPHHLDLFVRCLDTMCGLKRNLLGVENPSTLLKEIPDLSQRVTSCVPPELSYACRYWSDHLVNGLAGGADFSPEASGSLLEFVQGRLLYWLEACVLHEELSQAIEALDSAARICQRIEGAHSETTQLLWDCKRFVLSFIDCIQVSPLQLYVSALALAPRLSILFHTYASELVDSMVVLQGGLLEWGPCIASFSASDGEQFYSVKFSSDGSHFVTGGSDGAIKIWRALSCGVILSIEGAKEGVCSVSYSPDATQIASCRRGKIEVWNATSGAHIRTLLAGDDYLRCVTYTADGRHILSATFGGEVKLWEMCSGRCLLALNTGIRTRQVSVAAGSGDISIAYCVEDSLCLYNTSLHSLQHFDLPGNDLGFATLSPDGRYVAGAKERLLCIWMIADQSLLRSIPVPEGLCQLAFSSNGTQIACACFDGSVRVWGVTSDDLLLVLVGHTGWIWDIAWSPDDSRIISVGADGVTRLWDATLHVFHTKSQILSPPLDVLPKPTPRSVTILTTPECTGATILDTPFCTNHTAYVPVTIRVPDDAPMSATLCPDDTAAWNVTLKSLGNVYDLPRALRGASLWEFLSGKRTIGSAVAISEDETLIAYNPKNPAPASSGVIRVFNFRTGRIVATLVGLPNNTASMAFSSDSLYFACGSRDGTITVLHLTTGTLIRKNTAHPSAVLVVAFSFNHRLVVSASDDGVARIFELNTGHNQRVFNCYRVARMIFTVDDRHILSQGESGDVHLWDVATGDCVHHISLDLPSYTAWLYDITISPDDTGILVGQPGKHARSVALWRPGCRPWPVFSIDENGWIHAKTLEGTSRIGWVPPEWRGCLHSDGQQLYVADLRERKAVVLDMSRPLKYQDCMHK